MSSPLHIRFAVAASLALACLPSVAWAQADDVDPEMRVEQLENRLRQLTGQNEELQYRNRQLEEQLRQLQGSAPAGQRPGPATAPPQQNAPYQQPSQNQPYQNQPYQSAPPNAGQSAPMAPTPPGGGNKRGDAFDPNRNPNAPGVPRALGGGQLPMGGNAQGGRAPGEPLNLSNNPQAYPDQGYQQQGAPAQPPAGGAAPLTTLPPSATPKDEFDLGLGYIQRKDYGLAEETMRNFIAKYPSDRLVADAQYWLGESLYQRQRYRDAAESFLSVTTKYDKSAKAPDALLRLGQSLAALKEKEAACAAFGEITRKYPRASSGVKQGVAREQKRVGC
ncbi:MAG: tol-pal system protein YbgF [Afipia sp.]|nr:tol-pal system protein YbgF [Afipia sp.]OJW65624.1 MAG: tol-pal system protein YbgF [Afipia sp. 64-13]